MATTLADYDLNTGLGLTDTSPTSPMLSLSDGAGIDGYLAQTRRAHPELLPGPQYQRYDGRHQQQDRQTATHRLWLSYRDEFFLFPWILPFMHPRSPNRVHDCAPHPFL